MYNRAPLLTVLTATCLLAACSLDATPTRAPEAGPQLRQLGPLSAEVFIGDDAPDDGEGRHALIILHGCAQSATDIVNNTNLEDVADEFDAVVVVPTVPNGGVYFGCWDYYGSSHSRSSGHSGALLDMVDDMLGESDLDIGEDRVWISGLSSGGGMAAVMGCLAPDVFSGVGIAAGPAVGTSASQISSVAVTANQAENTCNNLAGSNSGDFDTQLASVIAGTSDYIVAQGYADVNADMFSQIYAGTGSLTESSFDVTTLEGYDPEGTGTLFSDGDDDRILQISATGMGHAWPGGTGAGYEAGYVAKEGVDYAWTLAAFFSENALRSSPTGGGSGDTGSGDTGTADTGTADTGSGDTGGGDTGSGDTGSGDTGSGDTGGGGGDCDAWVDTATAAVNGHLSRYTVYAAGYGAADRTYVQLFTQYGLYTTFTLYESEGGDWYVDSANVPERTCP